MEQSHLLTVKQAAELLGISPSLVYALIAARQIRHERYGLGRGCIRIELAAVEEYRLSRSIDVGAESSAHPKKNPSSAGFAMLDGERLKQAWASRKGKP